MERACTRHSHDPYEAETINQSGLTYIQLRCPICHRPQGLRLVRKVKG
jgi:hypothetical protein